MPLPCCCKHVIIIDVHQAIKCWLAGCRGCAGAARTRPAWQRTRQCVAQRPGIRRINRMCFNHRHTRMCSPWPPWVSQLQGRSELRFQRLGWRRCTVILLEHVWSMSCRYRSCRRERNSWPHLMRAPSPCTASVATSCAYRVRCLIASWCPSLDSDQVPPQLAMSCRLVTLESLSLPSAPWLPDMHVTALYTLQGTRSSTGTPSRRSWPATAARTLWGSRTRRRRRSRTRSTTRSGTLRCCSGCAPRTSGSDAQQRCN